MLLLFQSSGLSVRSPSIIPSWVRCGTWLYRFLIFAPLLTLIIRVVLSVLRGGPKKSPALSFNALIIPILRIVCTSSFHYSFPGQVWYLIVSIPDLCTLTYFGHVIDFMVPYSLSIIFPGTDVKLMGLYIVFSLCAWSTFMYRRDITHSSYVRYFFFSHGFCITNFKGRYYLTFRLL